MFVCVVSLPQPSSRDVLYVKCLCALSRYLSRAVEMCYMLNLSPSVEMCYMINVCCVVSLSQPSSRDVVYVKCLCVLPRYLSPVVEMCYMLHICVCCLVISAQ